MPSSEPASYGTDGSLPEGMAKTAEISASVASDSLLETN